jgi:hypothetical protein
MQSKLGGKLHLRLNTCVSPIANKYREGKLKRTLKRELNSTWNRLEVNEWSRSEYMGFSLLLKRYRCCKSVKGLSMALFWPTMDALSMSFVLRPIVVSFCRSVEGDHLLAIGFIAHYMVWYCIGDFDLLILMRLSDDGITLDSQEAFMVLSIFDFIDGRIYSLQCICRLSTCPVLKHGPRSFIWSRVKGLYETPRRN